MCGISLLLDRTGRLGPTAAERMRAATAHRGPDGCGSHQFGDGGPGTVYLGHNRLKIVDLSDEARQPMLSADGRYALVFNGEIYNWRELRAELETAGVRFRTQSDTEVLLQLLLHEGTDALPRLRGMFAFVFYDSAEQRVLAARDEHGIKPLFFVETDEGVAIASEVSAVIGAGLVAGAFNAAGLLQYLTARYNFQPRTLWQQVRQVMPAQWLTVTTAVGQPDLPLNPEEYQPPALPPAPRPEWPAAIESLLRQSLRRHLRADVPVGIWLSGGVDSTLLLALAREVSGGAPPCLGVSLAPSEGSFGTDDYQFGRRAAAQFGAEFTEFQVDDSILNHTDAALAALGQPIADSAVLLTWWLARQTRAAGLNVVLSGAGADEWFAGYNRHRAYEWLRQHQPWLTPLAPLLRAAGQALPTGYGWPGRKQLQLARKLLTRIRPEAGPHAIAGQFAALDETLVGLLQSPPPPYPEKRGALPENLLLDNDRRAYLPGDILALTDQTAMRHGLEVRTPYLDQDLTAFVGQITAQELLRHGPKWILRELLDARGGQAFTQRRKEGFGLPLTRWLRMPQYGWLFDPIRRPGHPLFEHLDYGRTQQFLTRFQAGRHDLGAEAWALITLFRWYDLQEFA